MQGVDALSRVVRELVRLLDEYESAARKYAALLREWPSELQCFPPSDEWTAWSAAKNKLLTNGLNLCRELGVITSPPPGQIIKMLTRLISKAQHADKVRRPVRLGQRWVDARGDLQSLLILTVGSNPTHHADHLPADAGHNAAATQQAWQGDLRKCDPERVRQTEAGGVTQPPNGPADPFSFRWNGAVRQFQKSERRFYRLLEVMWPVFRVRGHLSVTAVNDILNSKLGDGKKSADTLENYARDLSTILLGLRFPARLTRDGDFIRWENLADAEPVV